MTPTEVKVLRVYLEKLKEECARMGASKSMLSNVDDVEKSIRWMESHK